MTSEHALAHTKLHADFLKARSRFPWITADLQTLRNTLLSPTVELLGPPAQEHRIAFKDGDETLCYVHTPPQGLQRQDGMALLVHGLGGDASGTMIAYLTRALLQAGIAVTRVNLRAAPMVFHLARGFSHAGKSEDLRDIMDGLETALGPQAWHLLGISLGGNLTAKALGDGALEGLSISSAMTVCAPLDMQAASDCILKPRNKVYERHLLRQLKQAALKTGLEKRFKDAARAAASVFEFDDKVTAPFHGFGDAKTYYAQSSAGPHLKAITVPTLLLTAEDDPWIPAASYTPFEGTMSPSVRMIRARRGGHVGFHFKGSKTPAYCNAAVRWFMASAS